MIIKELEKIKTKLIKENDLRFPDDSSSSEMFKKKYEGNYYSDYPFNWIKPFINKLSLQVDFFLDTDHVDIKELPRKNDPIYIEIKNFPSYDYINSIAYEMLIRTEEYMEILNNHKDYSYTEKIKKSEQLGIDFNDEFSLKKVLYENYKNGNKINFSNSYFNMTLKDIDGGLDKLIDFYLNKKQIYIIDNENIYYPNKNDNKKGIILSRTFKVSSDVTFEGIKSNFSNYYIPAKYDYQTPENQNKSVIDTNIPLVALELDFLICIENLIPNRIKGVINFNFTRPLLRFKELPIVDVPINLNLSKKELNQLINKLKDDFEAGNIKNPINDLYNVKYKFEELEELVPFKMTKESISEAFFIYDLYKKINFAVMLHKSKLLYFKNRDLEKLKENIENKLKEKKNEIDEIINNLKNTKLIEINKRELRIIKRNLNKEEKEKTIDINKQYKEYSKEYNSMLILHELVKDYNISPYMCKQYLIFMRKYIENLKYKELIIGIKL
jgi:hypothetical protein